MNMNRSARPDRLTGSFRMRVRMAGACLLLPLAGQARAQGVGSKFDPTRDAARDVARAVERAGAEGKHVIVDVGGQWCTWCHVLDRFIQAQPEVKRKIDSDFVWVKVNVSPSNRNEQLMSRWPKMTGYPHFFVLDGQGRLVRAQASSELESGHDYDTGKVLRFLQQIRGS